MRKTNQTERVGMVLLTMLLLFFGACKRNELQPPMPSVLNSYQGTDKMVLQVIETLREPDNKALLAELEKQGGISWEYDALITSRFLQGLTLRFATGSDGNYLDAEIDARTRAIKLYSKQQQGQRDAMAIQAFNSKPNGKGTLAGPCTFNIAFEIRAVNRDEAIDAIFALVMVPLFVKHQEAIGFQAFGYKALIFTGNKTTDEVAQMLTDALNTFFPKGGYYEAQFIMLKITNSCGDEGPVLIQTIPPINWQRASPVISYQAGDSSADPLPFALSVTPFKENGFWKLKIQSMTGGVSMLIYTGGYRDPDLDPPLTAAQANDAINYMSAYFMRGAAQGWHTTAATLAHENYHYTEIKAIGNHYWQQAAACINGIKVPASGNDAADGALAENMAEQVKAVFLNTCNAYLKTLGDGAGDRPYAAGQLELNRSITRVKQRAESSGWWTTGGITIPNVDINNPTYQPFTPFYCPF